MPVKNTQNDFQKQAEEIVKKSHSKKVYFAIAIIFTAIAIGLFIGIAVIVNNYQCLENNKNEIDNKIVKLVNQKRECIKEGEKFYLKPGELQEKECCNNLKTGAVYSIIKDECIPETIASICIDCPNDVCGLGENKCNCPEDCKEEPDTFDWQTYRNEEFEFEFKYPVIGGANNEEIFIKEKNNRIEVCVKPYGDNDWCHSLRYYEKPKEETIESSIKRQILDEDEQVICTIEKASFGLENRFTGCYIDCPSIGPSGFAYNHYVIDSNHPELFFMYSTGHDMIFDIDKWINSIRFIEN